MSISEADQPRDRYMAFAFAGADLLIETDPHGVIRFAAGAFGPRMGVEPGAVIGRHLYTLLAPVDRDGLAIALETVLRRGRIAPLVLRLNDAARTPVSVAAIVVPSTPPRICVTLGQVPNAPVADRIDAGDPGALVREAKLRLHDGQGGKLALLELANWPALQESLSTTDRQSLRAGIVNAITTTDGGARPQEFAEGRFGVVVNDTDEITAIVQRLDALARNSLPGKPAQVDRLELSLGAGTLTPSQAARALCYTLSRFRSGGAAAVRAAGADDGLAGVLAGAVKRIHAFRTAIADGRFQMKYQPVASLVDRSTHHFEALIRPFGAVIGADQSTQDFVVFAEAMGLSEDLDLAVAETVLATLRANPEVSIAVNVSGLSMQNLEFRERLLEILARADAGTRDLAPRLLLELTETVEIEDVAAAAVNIGAFRELGIGVCLDDFGAGAAAFTYLREFPVDFVKIDGLYVTRAALGSRERSFVSSMVDLASSVGARVIAERIETEAEAQLMRLLGVEFGQGWLFGRPGMLPGESR